MFSLSINNGLINSMNGYLKSKLGIIIYYVSSDDVSSYLT